MIANFNELPLEVITLHSEWAELNQRCNGDNEITRMMRLRMEKIEEEVRYILNNKNGNR